MSPQPKVPHCFSVAAARRAEGSEPDRSSRTRRPECNAYSDSGSLKLVMRLRKAGGSSDGLVPSAVIRPRDARASYRATTARSLGAHRLVRVWRAHARAKGARVRAVWVLSARRAHSLVRSW